MEKAELIYLGIGKAQSYKDIRTTVYMRVRYSFSSRRTGRIDSTNRHKLGYSEIAREVIDMSDIIIQVMDARFIPETMDYNLKEKFKGKIIISVANKSDLALEEEAKNKRGVIFISCIKRKGIRKLRDRIKILAKMLKKEEVNVGVVGYPNTGKSSLINVLVGRRAARTAPKPGTTKGMQKISLGRGIKIFDTPGVIPENEMNFSERDKERKLSIINSRSVERVNNPEFVIVGLMRSYPQLLEKHYDIEANGDAEKLLELVGKKRHMLRKGGEVDVERTARAILKEWQDGKIKSKKP